MSESASPNHRGLQAIAAWLAAWAIREVGDVRDDDIDGLRRAERARDTIGHATTHDRETTCRPTH